MIVIYWTTSGNKAPVAEYIKTLALTSPSESNGILEDIITLREFGTSPLLTRKFTKFKGCGSLPIWELISGKHRVIFPIVGESAYLVHAFRKDSQQTRPKHIKLGINRYKSIMNNI